MFWMIKYLFRDRWLLTVSVYQYTLVKFSWSVCCADLERLVWSESSRAVFRPVFPQLCVHVVIDPCDEGKYSDSHSSADPDRARRTPTGHNTVTNSHDTAEKYSYTAFRTAFMDVLPSWMSTQQEPENREHESGKLPKSNDYATNEIKRFYSLNAIESWLNILWIVVTVLPLVGKCL